MQKYLVQGRIPRGHDFFRQAVQSSGFLTGECIYLNKLFYGSHLLLRAEAVNAVHAQALLEKSL
jgi:hypothetical protein